MKKLFCTSCLSEENICIHHIDRNHDNNEPSNLDFLCPHCHGTEHGIEGSKEQWESVNISEGRKLRIGYEMTNDDRRTPFMLP